MSHQTCQHGRMNVACICKILILLFFFFFGTMADPIVMKDACDFLGLGVL
jgi:hypothetical protein